MPPNSLTTAAASARHESGSETSTGTPRTFPEPRVSRSATAASRSAAERAAIATLAPAVANTAAIPRPMPLLPPVTRTDVDCRSNIGVSLSQRGWVDSRPKIDSANHVRSSRYL